MYQFCLCGYDYSADFEIIDVENHDVFIFGGVCDRDGIGKHLLGNVVGVLGEYVGDFRTRHEFQVDMVGDFKILFLTVALNAVDDIAGKTFAEELGANFYIESYCWKFSYPSVFNLLLTYTHLFIT